ncbi:hypothetical protein B0H10DRAFT_1374809 [Mycena sp. CBHHK59/15]|nr:hypothetical protein B0H10DRAFT_1374809 [Mycena sp. CBHHK59/15]
MAHRWCTCCTGSYVPLDPYAFPRHRVLLHPPCAGCGRRRSSVCAPHGLPRSRSTRSVSHSPATCSADERGPHQARRCASAQCGSARCAGSSTTSARAAQGSARISARAGGALPGRAALARRRASGASSSEVIWGRTRRSAGGRRRRGSRGGVEGPGTGGGGEADCGRKGAGAGELRVGGGVSCAGPVLGGARELLGQDVDASELGGHALDAGARIGSRKQTHRPEARGFSRLSVRRL